MKRSRRMKACVERALHVGGEDRQAAISLHALQQIVDLDVGVAVVAVLDFAALAEQRVGFVEEQDRAAVLGGVEQPAQVLLRLADVFADDGRQIDAVEIAAAARWRCTSAAIVLPVPLSPANRALMPGRGSAFVGKAPLVVHLAALAHLGRDLAKQPVCSARQHDVLKARPRLDPLRQGIHHRTHTRATCIP